MTNNGILSVAVVKGVDMATSEWSISDEIIANAIAGIVDNVPAESMVEIERGHHEPEIVIRIANCITMCTRIGYRGNMENFEFLFDIGEQRAVDVAGIIHAVIGGYLDSSIRPLVVRF